MRLIANWRAVLRYAWSLRLMVVAAVLSAVEVAVPYLDGVLPVPPGLFAVLAALVTLAAMIARFVAQAPLQKGDDR